MAHAQHVARALYEADVLDAFVTSFVWRDDSRVGRLLDRVPSTAARRLQTQLGRRAISEVPPDLVHTHPFWETARTAAMKLVKSPVLADQLWDRLSHSFDTVVARRHVSQTKSIQCFEYTALASFEKARSSGVTRILHLPSLDSREFEDIQRREKERWPELRGSHDDYFAAKFEKRYERRQQEIALADVIIANSGLTARSHIKAGADPRKVFAVPLAAPPTIAHPTSVSGSHDQPLRILWAGSFSLRKGAHYLLQAWQSLRPGTAAQLDVYGQPQLPERLYAGGTDGVVFYGSVPRSQLFNAYQKADALVFPTLSDGFGMVVSEALAHALPVITTDRAGAVDLITKDNGLVVPAADPGALADALRWCLDNRRRLAEMRYHALEAARRRQWSDFRRDLTEALSTGLIRAGHQPTYRPLP